MSAPVVINVLNKGPAKLFVSALTLSGADPGDFVLMPSVLLPFTVDPSGGSVPFTVYFVPTATGLRTASVVVTSNDPVSPVISLPLNGNGS
jgi:hypothetical protein